MDLKRKIVMLVDDEESVRALVKTYLEALGVYVLVADGAPAASRLAQASPLHIDLLITDVLLPYVNGRDLANRISQQRPDLKVLFISGYPIEVLESHGLCPARAELLLKPFGRKELAEKVHAVLESALPWKRVVAPADGGTRAGGGPSRETALAGPQHGDATRGGPTLRTSFHTPPVEGP